MSALSTQSDLNPIWAAESNLLRILAVTGFVYLLALVSVGLCLYVRICLLHTPGTNDAVIVMASV